LPLRERRDVWSTGDWLHGGVVIGRARRHAVCTILIGALAIGACTKTTGKVMMGVGGAVTAGTLISLGVRDCSAPDNEPGACETPRAEAFVLLPALAVTLAGFFVWATAEQPAPAPATALDFTDGARPGQPGGQ
jgi:hypothetical protein